MSSLLEVRDLRTSFFTRRGEVRAVRGISFSLDRGQTIGLVGESGCGKTITCMSILRLVPKPGGRIVGGQIIFDGEDLLKKSERQMTKIRGKRISMILQDPMTSLNPVFSIGDQVGESISLHGQCRGAILREKIKNVLEMVRISAPYVVMKYYPHQMSGGMRQRAVGAIAISCNPELLIADEPTTALDVTIQYQYLNLLKEVQQKLGAAMIFITHDFGIVARMCDYVSVMYAGKIVESGSTRELLKRPMHPYTAALLKCVPNINIRTDKLYSIEGQPPSLLEEVGGCSFAQRCEVRNERCLRQSPPTVQKDDTHHVACWLLCGRGQ